MGKDSDKGKPITSAVGAGLGAAAGPAGKAIAVATGVSADAATGGLAVAGATGVEWVAGAISRWRRKRQEKRLEQALEYFEDVDKLIALLETNEEVAAIFLEAMRALEEALSDAAVPILARLAKDYLSVPKPRADRFFRGVLRFVRDASDAELDLAQRVFAMMVDPKLPPEAEGGEVVLRSLANWQQEHAVIVQIARGLGGGWVPGDPADGRALCRGLQDTWLAEPYYETGGTVEEAPRIPDEPEVCLDLSVAVQLERYFVGSEP